MEKRCLGREQQRKRAQEKYSATMACSLRVFMEMGLVSGLSLDNHSDSGSFLVVNSSLRQDEYQQVGF